MKDLFEGAPLNEDESVLVDRWYCKETDTYYPAWTSTREVEKDLIEMNERKKRLASMLEMGKPEWVDEHLVSKEDLTDRDYWLSDNDKCSCICPVCGSPDIVETDTDTDDFDTIVNGYRCYECGSEFSYTYWVKVVVVRKDGRFN